MEVKHMSHILAGFIIGCVNIAILTIYYYKDLIFESSYISFIPLGVTIILTTVFVWKFGQDHRNKVTFGNLFGYGFKVTIIFSLVMTAFLFLVLNFFHEYKARYIEELKERANLQRNLTNDQKEATLKITSSNTFIIGSNLFINLIASTAGALLGATISKKKPTVTN